MSWKLRLVSGLAGVAVLALLLVAARLEPAQAGIGTHQQLGLPPCTFVTLWEMPCPTCGMTTSWSQVVRGNLTAAARANVGGLMLAAIAIAYLPASCYFMLSGRASQHGWFSAALAISLIAALLVAIIQWLIKLG